MALHLPASLRLALSVLAAGLLFASSASADENYYSQTADKPDGHSVSGNLSLYTSTLTVTGNQEVTGKIDSTASILTISGNQKVGGDIKCKEYDRGAPRTSRITVYGNQEAGGTISCSGSDTEIIVWGDQKAGAVKVEGGRQTGASSMTVHGNQTAEKAVTCSGSTGSLTVYGNLTAQSVSCQNSAKINVLGNLKAKDRIDCTSCTLQGFTVEGKVEAATFSFRWGDISVGSLSLTGIGHSQAISISGGNNSTKSILRVTNGNIEVESGEVSLTGSHIYVTTANAGQAALVVGKDSMVNWSSAYNILSVETELDADLRTLTSGASTLDVVLVDGKNNYGDDGANVDIAVHTDSSFVKNQDLTNADVKKVTVNGREQLVATFTLDTDALKGAALEAYAPVGEGIANALYGSIGAVEGLGHAALHQLDCRPATGSRAWVQGLGRVERASSTGTASGYHVDSFGYAAGYDRALSPAFVLGAAFGQEFGTSKSRGSETRVRQSAAMGTLYGHYAHALRNGDPACFVSGYASYGQVRNRARAGVLGETVRGRWTDDVFSLGLRVGRQVALDSHAKWSLAPFAGLEYTYASQGDADMAGDGFSLHYHDGGMQVWSVPVGIRLQGCCSMGGTRYLLPELELAYVGDISRRDPQVKTPVFGHDATFRGTEAGRHALRLQCGARYTLTDSTTLGLFYGLEYRTREFDQNAGANVSLSF